MTNIKYILISSLLVISAGCGTPQSVPNNSPSPTQSTVVSSPSASASPTSSVNPSQSSDPQDAIPDGKKLAVSKIVAGTSYGMCIGYCQQQVTFNPTTLTVSKRANGNGVSEIGRGTAQDNAKYPDISKDFEFPQSEWNSLYTTVDTAKFQASEERIGCPDCADGGAEFIEITTPNYTKRITFEAGKTIEGMEAFVEQVRALRIKYLEQVK